MSRKWDAREAGREVAREVIQKLKRPPSFFLLFSTIHYEKHGGFEEFLAGVWDVLPEGTPLVGGTVAGFINSQGCYTRGATATAFSYPNMDVAVGIGKNAKRNPKKAAISCAEMIRRGLKESKYPNKFVFSLISSSIVFNLPIVGSKKVVRSHIFSKIVLKMLPLMNRLLQIGVGKEDEVFSKMRDELPDFSGVFGSSMDDMSFLRNYQFFDNRIYKNSIVTIGISSFNNTYVDSFTGMEETDIKLKITKKSPDCRVINCINDRIASDEFIEIMGCGKDYLTDERIYDVAPYFPIGYNKDGKVVAQVVGYYLGNSLMTPYKNNYDELSLLSVSGKKLLNAVKEAFVETKYEQKKFALMVSCATILYTLGNKVYETQKAILEEMNDKPFLLLFTGGEGSFDRESIYVGNETHTQATFLE